MSGSEPEKKERTAGSCDRKSKPTYSEMLGFMQPRPIKNDKQCAIYQGWLDGLLDKLTLTQDEIDLRDLLGILISEYESKNPLPDAKPHKVIQHLLKQKNIKSDDLVSFLGGQLYWFGVISGDHPVNENDTYKLAEFFGVSADLFR